MDRPTTIFTKLEIELLQVVKDLCDPRGIHDADFASERLRRGRALIRKYDHEHIR